MFTLQGFLLPRNCNTSRRSMLFNTAANALDAAQTLLLFIVITRTCGAVEGGIFSISMAIAYQMVTIGRYGMRDYQATDIRGDFSFSAYFFSRVVTVFGMFVWLAAYIVLGGYEPEKASIIIAVAFYKSIDVLEDVYHGYYQHEGRLDSASLAQTIRLGSTIVLYISAVLLSSNLLLSTIISAIYSLLAFVFLNRVLRAEFSDPVFLYGQCTAIKKLLLICAPLGISGFLQLFIVNYPKYAIDMFLSDTAQSYYGALSMPVFVINLLSISIFRPLLIQLAQHWHSSNKPALNLMLRKQLCFVAAVTATAMIAGYLLGIPVLTWMYGIDLNGYRPSLMILLMGGGMAALSGFMTSIIAVIRAQKYLLIVYGLTMLLEVGIAPILVQNMGVYGASILFTASMLMLAIVTSGIVIGVMMKSHLQERKTQ